jgi:hypothetical protein
VTSPSWNANWAASTEASANGPASRFPPGDPPDAGVDGVVAATVRERQLDVDARLDGRDFRGPLAGGHAVFAPEERHTVVVRDDRPVEAPLAPEAVRQESFVAGARSPVDVVVRVHYRGRVTLADHRLERERVHLAELPLADLYGRAVLSPSPAPWVTKC